MVGVSSRRKRIVIVLCVLDLACRQVEKNTDAELEPAGGQAKSAKAKSQEEVEETVAKCEYSLCIPYILASYPLLYYCSL